MSQYPIAMNQLKADLGFFDAALPVVQEEYLESLLHEAEERLRTECGIAIDPAKPVDASLQALWAAWRYRKRVTGEDKPPMLRTAIREWQLARARTEEGA